MKRFAAALLLSLAIMGCTVGGQSAAPEPPTPAPPEGTVPPDPTKPLRITHEDGKVLVEGLSRWTVHPASDGSAFAFFTPDGVWAIDPQGEALHQLVKSNKVVELIDLTQERLLYLESRGDQLLVLEAERGLAPVPLAAVAVSRLAEQSGRIPTWTALRGDRLTLAVAGELLMQVDLGTGNVTTIGDATMSVAMDTLSLSLGGRYLVQKREHSKEPVRIYDLEMGTVTQPEGEYHLNPYPSPVDGRYAVLAAEVDSGLPMGTEGTFLEGGTHIDMGMPDGTVRHLHPPERLALDQSPVWSPDGTRMAIQLDKPYGPVWLVDVDSGTWSPFVLPESGLFIGWLDEEQILFLAHAGGGPLYRLPTAGGQPEPVPQENGSVTLADGTQVYRPHDVTGRDSVWVKRPGDAGGIEVLGGESTYDQLIPMGRSVGVVNHQAGVYRLFVLTP